MIDVETLPGFAHLGPKPPHKCLRNMIADSKVVWCKQSVRVMWWDSLSWRCTYVLPRTCLCGLLLN